MSGDVLPLFVPIYVVDAFTERPFHGNQAAVCLVSPGQLQIINSELMSSYSDSYKPSIMSSSSFSDIYKSSILN
uniref:Phenazine biosynthesis-like domain-containing protein n=1 Tax=Arion vulgaris TaxID=1028688 RepID=A0A0B7AAV1_9EUPU